MRRPGRASGEWDGDSVISGLREERGKLLPSATPAVSLVSLGDWMFEEFTSRVTSWETGSFLIRHQDESLADG